MTRRRAEVIDYSEENGEDSLEETTAATADANNSIIGKMRSSVTSILPNSLSKWFSPSSNNNNNNDSANGSYVAIKRSRSEADANTPHARIERRSEMSRRRIEVSDYAEDDDGGGDGVGDGDDLEDEAADESNSDDVEINTASPSVQRRRNFNLISPFDVDQPPSKRSRMTLDGTMLSSHPLVASTPAVNVQRNSGVVNNHYGHLNLYTGANRKELGYNFYSSSTSAPRFEQQNSAPDIIDLIPIPMSSADNDMLNVRKGNQNIETEATRSRRSLNIPPTTTKPLGSKSSNSVLPLLKRQSLSSVKSNLGTTDSRQNVDFQSYDHKNDPITLNRALELDEGLLDSQTYNGGVQQNFQNGVTEFEDELRHRSVTDSEAEDADTLGDLPTNASIHSTSNVGMVSQRVASSGLFNMSSGNSRSGSRTSSFGNGLNFYTHLEGRKSLFAGNNPGTRTNIGNPLNSSTLSLNSLSRRQFNASIYGSTSALSDSRLLNTSSPFYKGNTTYGGAAAYSKYATSLGSNSRLTPTLIRPTSSLSTLSSSSNSIAAGAGTSTAHGEQNPAISGTAKTILDLLNGFTTPLSEAKKMANSLRQQSLSTMSPHSNKSKRLSDDDLHASRTMRLQQVRTPYMRPAVILQPKKSTKESQMPPVRELQVPSMSQLLQMKKLQSLTERSRQITMQKSSNEECSVPTFSSATKSADMLTETIQQKSTVYTLPTSTTPEQHIETASIFDSGSKSDSKQMKHVNKIKNKIAYPARSVPDMPDESPPIPANLPNIAFPMMAEMPKIDIALPTTSKKNVPQQTETDGVRANIKKPVVETDSKHITDNFKFSPPVGLKNKPSSMLGIEPSTIKFEFSKPEPLELTRSGTTAMKTEIQSEIRPALPSGQFALPISNAPTSVPTLKTGSVLDALKKPFVLPKSSSSNTSETANSTTTTQPLSSFGSQFQKSANEWECDTCMVRNKENAQKCVACDVPRKGGAVSTSKPQISLTTAAATVPLAAGFGGQFKKQTGEWECDTCMVRNKSDVDKCVSCETARKTVTKSISQADTPKPFGQSIFGNPLNITPLSTVAIPSDSGFKSLAAAQQTSKWECVACMTRNESSRSKCACCEQPKPGIENQKENAPSFNFGATAASKFSFGFGAGAPDPAKDNIIRHKAPEPSVKTNISAEKPEDGKTTPPKGFIFGTGTATVNTQNSQFSFGFQAKSTETPDKSSIATNKDNSDGPAKATGFNVSFANSASPKANTNVTSSAKTTKDETLTTSTATTSSATATTAIMATMASFTPPKVTSFSFGNTPTATTATVSTLATTKPQEGFGFGLGFQKPVTNTVSSPATTVSSSSTSKISFPIATATTVASLAATNSVSGTTNTAGPAFSFGVVSTSATSTTMTSKPMFSFGAPSVPTTSMGNVSSSTTGSGVAVSISSSLNAGTIGFGITTNSTPNTLASPSIAAAKSPFAVTPNANTNPTLNSFAAFGSPKSNNQTPSTTTATASPAPAFGTFNFAGTTTPTSKTEGGNLFGTLTHKTQDSKPIASAVPIFGNATAQAEPKTTTSNTWPKNSFLFGSPASIATAKMGTIANNEPASTAVFGSLKPEVPESTTASTNNIQNATSSIFGSVGVSSSAPSFGSSSAGSTVIFGTGSTPAAANSTNVFGSNNNNTALPQFGTMNSGQTTLGNNSTAIPALPAFGNTTPVGFGSFGAASVTASATSTTNSEVSTHPAATPFAFGASQTQTASSGFNFGTTAATSRPAFNFTSTNQPTFNFTGSTTETTQNSTRPFQFGATAAPSFNAPPVFSFGSAPSTETTSNTPFQFNAGSAPATSNIFAPAPTSSTTTQAARRKVRIPNRRLPPR